MSDLDRAERRRRRKTLLTVGDKYLKAGLQKRAPRDVLAVAALALADGAKSPADLAARQHQAFETASRIAAPSDKLACAKGCAYCCHVRVLVSVPEAFLIARWVLAKGPTHVLEFRQRAQKIAGKSAEQRFGAKLPCPLLVNNVCSAYQNRPLNCRQTTSMAVAPCIEEFEGKPGDVSVPAHYPLHAENARILEATALVAAGKPVVFYELASAVLRILDTPDAEARWMAGDAVFNGLEPDAASNAVAAEAGIAAGLQAQALDGGPAKA
ncbi:MAG: hypothetical protein RL291_1705 [Pseudomonadota bacterium]